MVDDVGFSDIGCYGGEAQEHPEGFIGETKRPWTEMIYVPLETRDGRPVTAGDFPHIMPGPDDTYQGYGLGWANVSNTPFRLYKSWVHEGGIATPLMVHWPAGIGAVNELRRQPGHIFDIMATCLDAAGIDYPTEFKGRRITPMKGKSLIPAFANQSLDPRPLFWEHQGNRAVRKGRWKLVSRFLDRWELHDLEADRTEMTDLAGRNPEVVKELLDQYEKWKTRSGVIPWDELQSIKKPLGKNPLIRQKNRL